MKKILLSLLAATVFSALCPCARAAEAPAQSAASCILVEKDGVTVLYESNADEKRLIASTTKIMTALVVLENASPDEEVLISAEAALTEGSSMYLKAGERYTVRVLLYGLLMHSGNDAATALALHVAGTTADFAAMMNEKARELGMASSSFENPHGLDSERHYSTARDMAKLCAAALDDPLFAEIVSTREISLDGRHFTNHNKLLWNCGGVIGVKTGYTQAAGRTLVSACQRDGLTLICVTLNDGNDWSDHAALYDWGFSRCERVTAAERGQRFGGVEVISGVKAGVEVEAAESLSILTKKGAEISVERSVPEFVYAEVRAGDRAGELIVFADGQEAGRVELVYSSDVPLDENQPLSRWERFKRAWYLANKYSLPMTGGLY